MHVELTRALLKILAAIDIQSPRTFSFGEHVMTVGGLPQRGTDTHAGPDGTELVRMLLAQLYHRCYCRRFQSGLPDGPRYPVPDDHFVTQLSEANASHDRLSRGWRLLCLLPTGRYIAQKNGVIRVLAPGQCLLEPPDISLKEGALVSLRWPKESTTTQPTFYFAFGEEIGDRQDDTHLLKVYWNVKAVGVSLLVRLLTQRLNRFQLPFRLKCLNNPAAYTRTDAAVLFMNRRFWRVAAPLLADVHRQMADCLEGDVPLFSKRLADGLGVAEEPDNGESFGQQRCRMLAEAIWHAHRLHRRDDYERLEEVARQFELHGVSLDTPHLEPGSVDQYEWFQ
jgi:hypothetical protein